VKLVVPILSLASNRSGVCLKRGDKPGFENALCIQNGKYKFQFFSRIGFVIVLKCILEMMFYV